MTTETQSLSIGQDSVTAVTGAPALPAPHALQLAADAADVTQVMSGTSPLSYFMTRNLPAALNSTVNIGNLATTNGVHNHRLSLSMTDAGVSVSKKYDIAVQANQFPALVVITPTRDSGPVGGNDIELLCAVIGNTCVYVVRRKTAGAAVNAIAIRLESTGPTDEVLVEATATGLDATAYATVGASVAASNNRVNLADFPANAPAGAAAATVDVADVLTFTQTTPNITVTLPAPTTLTLHKRMWVENLAAATTSITVAGADSVVLAPGDVREYAWQGTAWKLVSPANLVATIGQTTFAASSATVVTAGVFADIVGYNFLLPSAGTYELTTNIRAGSTVTTADSVFGLFDVTLGAFIANSEGEIVQNAAASNTQVSGTRSFQYTVNGPTVIKVQAKFGGTTGTLNVNSDANGRSAVSWKKISGNVPFSGATVDFVTARLSADFNYNTTAANDIIINTAVNGNIPLNTGTGVFALSAGKTYRLSASIIFSNSNVVGRSVFAFVDSGTNVPISAAASFAVPQVTGTATSGSTDFIYTAAANQNIKLRNMSGNSTNTILVANESVVEIVQIGSTATTPTPLPNVQVITVSGLYVPSVGLKYADFEGVGGGGGSSGAQAGSVSTISLGGAGGAGGTLRVSLTAAQIGASQAITIGLAGAGGGVGGAGGAGTATSIGALCTANGGGGGALAIAAGNWGARGVAGAPGGTVAITTGTDLGSKQGDAGGPGFGAISGVITSFSPGNGASSNFGRGGVSVPTGNNNTTPIVSAGVASAGFGAGGAGSGSTGTGATATTGGNGTPGKIIIREYF